MEENNTKPQQEEVVLAKPDNLRWYIVASSSGKENKTAELIKQRIN